MNRFLTPSRHTWLHRANPSLKLAVLIMLFIVTIQTRSIDFAVYQAAVYIALLFLLSGYPAWKVALLVLSFSLVFVSSSLTMILFGKGDHVWWQWGLFRVSEESFYRGLHLGFRAIAFAAEGLLFVMTTPSVKLFYSLMQNFRLPPKFAYSFMASIRLLSIVWEEFLIRRQALRIRGVRTGRGPSGLLEHVRLYAVPLLSQSIRRAHRVAVAMEAKQFSGSGRRTYYYPSAFSRYDGLAVLMFVIALAAAYYASAAVPWFGIEDVRYHGQG